MIAKLGNCFSIIRNGASIKQVNGASGLPITRIETIAKCAVDRNKFGYADIYDACKYEDYLLHDQDILMSHINSEKHLGKVAIYHHKNGEQIIHGMNLLMLRANQDIVFPQYAAYYFESPFFKRQIVSITKKSVNQASFTVTALKELNIPILPITEQRKIVAVLDKVSDLIAKRHQQLSKLDKLVKARFVEMFGSYSETINLSEVAMVSGGLTKNSKRDKLPLRMPYLRVANVAYASIDVSEMLDIGLTEDEYEKTLLQYDDLLFVEGNGSPDQIGRVAIWKNEIVPCVHQNHLIKSRFNKSVILPVFAMYYFMSQNGREQIRSKAVSTSGLYTLSVSKVSNLMIPAPPMELQGQFASFVEQTDKSKLAVQKSLDKLEVLKKALMQQYFG